MNRTQVWLAAIAAGVAMASAAQAQPPGPPPPGAEGPRDPAQREARLREALSITPAQESAFKAWLAGTGPDSGLDPASMENLTTPERLNRQLGDLQTKVRLTTQLYSQLSADQRQTFDRLPPNAIVGPPPRGPVATALRDRAAERVQSGQQNRGAGGYNF